MENFDLHVVIADSNVQDRESKTKIMEGVGMKVVLSTGDGSKALEAIKQKKVDVVVMDMILPGVDGIGILEEINNGHQKNRPIFIVETALRMENLVEQAIQSGADYYMMKPVSGQMLIKRMYQMVESKYGMMNSNREPEHHAVPAKKASIAKKKPTSKMGYTYSGDLEVDITKILLEIGIPAHIKGYQYIREGIIMAFKDRNMLHYITKFLYPAIAKKYKTTSSSVERTIRHAIEVAWRRGNMDILDDIFGNTICSGRGKPTNSEFMALLTDKLRLEYRQSTAS